jgi:hypothetical protein
MKRCTAYAYILATAASVFYALPATAQTPTVREFPAAAMRAEMTVQNHPQITLNDKPERLSPGARIFDTRNLIALSGQLQGQRLTVNYLRDSGNQIERVWILNPEEAKQKRAGSERTIFNFTTGSAPTSP